MMVALYQALMWAGSFWCHQIPERSPHIFGTQLPLCWRCSGIAVGSLLLICIVARARRLPALGISFALACLMPVDVFGAVIGLWDGHNPIRFVTGTLWGIFGIAAALQLIALLVGKLRETRVTEGQAVDHP
jgi:uncharacterized membrane protein